MKPKTLLFKRAVHQAMEKLSATQLGILKDFLQDADVNGNDIRNIVVLAVQELMNSGDERFEQRILYAIVLALNEEFGAPTVDTNLQRLRDLETWRKSGEIGKQFPEWLRNWYQC